MNRDPADGDAVGARRRWWLYAPALVAVALFLAFAVAVLVRPAQLLEPDDYAYRASITALTHGQVSLTTAQYQELSARLSEAAGPGILQWVQVGSDKWISEKNPGYPFLAAPFEVVGLLPVAPLAYGALACAALFVGARRWLGRWAGTYAVVLFCGSGAALTFAWRATMPTFTDASLVAGGAGLLLWTLLATDRSDGRRTVAGLLGFLALAAAVAVRYPNVVILAVAILAALVLAPRTGIRWRAVAVWLGAVLAIGALVLAFNQVEYGNALTTGYRSGVITFSFGAILPNLRTMPPLLVAAMPMSLLAIAAVVWIAIRGVRSSRLAIGDARRTGWRRDAVVGAVLLVAWAAVWCVYAMYDWTVTAANGPGSSVHVIRFYVPALGPIALLATWLLMQLPKWLPPVVLAVLVGAAGWSYLSLAGTPAGGPGMGGPGMGRPGSAPGVPGGGPGAGPGGQFGPPPDSGPPGPGLPPPGAGPPGPGGVPTN